MGEGGIGFANLIRGRWPMYPEGKIVKGGTNASRWTTTQKIHKTQSKIQVGGGRVGNIQVGPPLLSIQRRQGTQPAEGQQPVHHMVLPAAQVAHGPPSTIPASTGRAEGPQKRLCREGGTACAPTLEQPRGWGVQHVPPAARPVCTIRAAHKAEHWADRAAAA